MSNPTWQELVAQCYNTGVDLSAKACMASARTATHVSQGWSAGSNVESEPFQYNSYGMVANEVEVDVLTGEVQILQTDILFDCGQRFAASRNLVRTHMGLQPEPAD